MRRLTTVMLLICWAATASGQSVEDRLKRLERRCNDLEWENKQLKKSLEARKNAVDKAFDDAEREREAIDKRVAANTAAREQGDRVDQAIKLMVEASNRDIKSLGQTLGQVKGAVDKVQEWKGVVDEAKETAGKVKEMAQKVRDLPKKVEELFSKQDKLDDVLEKVASGGGDSGAKLVELERKAVARDKRLADLELTVKRWHDQDLKELREQDKMFGDTLRDHWKSIEALKKADAEAKKERDSGTKQLTDSLVKNEAFMKAVLDKLGRVGLVKSLTTALPKERAFLGAIATNADFQKSMAYNLSKSHVRSFAEALLKYELFQKGLEYRLVKSTRYLKARAEADVKLGSLQALLAGDDRMLKGLSTNMAKESYLRYLIDGLGRSYKFASTCAESSSFTEKLAKSSKFVRALTDNSDFKTKVKAIR